MILQKIKSSTNFSKKHPAYDKKIKDKKTTIYICQKQKCSLPITNFNEFQKILNINNGTIQ